MSETPIADKPGGQKPTCSPLVKRHAWMLFTDLNTRFNILIEECAHLQDMVWSMLGNLDDPSGVSANPIQDFKTRTDRIQDTQPPWSQLPARQRALRSLYNFLGGLYLGLTANQRTCRKRFDRLCEMWTPEQFFWFSAQRNLFIRTQFETYADQLQHAQFKLIQIAENKPGSLPQATLLRRWNSALFGDFLSAYSRHVDWETAALAWIEKFHKFEDKALGKPFYDDRRQQYLLHSWGHVATSRVRSHSVILTLAEDADSRDSQWRFHSIRSAFFYLEMPQLFPLLYHECAHIHLGSGTGTGDLFGLREQLTDYLTAEAEHEPRLPQGRAVWHALTGEIWADLIAVALGGVGFVSALAMQLFASQDGAFFETSQVPITALGSDGSRIWDVPALGAEATFWDVRLRLAVAACQELHAEQLDVETSNWLNGLTKTIDLYQEGTRHVFAFSEQHHQLAAHRLTVANDLVGAFLKVLETTWKTHLAGYVGDAQISTAYCIDGTFGDKIREAITNLHNAVFNPAPPRHIDNPQRRWPYRKSVPGRSGKRLERIEEIALRAKWCFAGGAVDKLEALAAGGDDLGLVTDVYANRIRNDGSGAFRLAMEYVLARFSATDAIADALLGRPVEGFWPWLKDVLGVVGYEQMSVLAGWAGPEGGETVGQRWSDDDRDFLARWLKVRNYDTDSRYQGLSVPHLELMLALDRVQLFNKLDEWLLHHVGAHLGADAATNTDPAQSSWFKIAPLGTISLGVVSPQFVATRGATGAYGDAMREVHRAFAENGNVQRLNAQIERMKDAFGSEKGFSLPDPYLLPLLGEYSFLLYREHLTPVERQHESPARVQALLKPRAVLRLFTSGGGVISGAAKTDTKGEASGGADKAERTDAVSVSLIEFAYRWQAFALRDRLASHTEQHADQCPFTAAELFLSSGWETCILVLRLPRVEDFWQLFWEKDGLGLGCGCEHVQTYFGIPWARFDKMEAPKNTDPAPPDHVHPDECDLPLRPGERDALCQAFYDCTGRDDFTLCWKAKTVEGMFKRLNELPQQFWQSIDRLSLSCRRHYPRSIADAPAVGKAAPGADDTTGDQAQARGELEFTGHIVRLGPFARNWRRRPPAAADDIAGP